MSPRCLNLKKLQVGTSRTNSNNQSNFNALIFHMLSQISFADQSLLGLCRGAGSRDQVLSRGRSDGFSASSPQFREQLSDHEYTCQQPGSAMVNRDWQDLPAQPFVRFVLPSFFNSSTSLPNVWAFVNLYTHVCTCTKNVKSIRTVTLAKIVLMRVCVCPDGTAGVLLVQVTSDRIQGEIPLMKAPGDDSEVFTLQVCCWKTKIHSKIKKFSLNHVSRWS